MLRVMAKASQEAEDASEDIAQSFLQNSMPADAFLRQYRVARKKYHLRNARYERVLADATVNPKHRPPS